jgi:histone H3/H4
MASIPAESIKRMVSREFGLQITDDAARALAKMLESRAKRISRFAVLNSRKRKGDKITKEDIQEYVLKAGLDDA